MPHSHFDPTAFEFRPLAAADVPLLRDWLQRPHVAEWWGPAESIEELRADYIDATSLPNSTLAYIARYAGRDVGFVQCYVVTNSGGGWWEDETDPGARGIDQFLADPSLLNAGLGRAMIRAFVARVFADPAVTVIQTDPSPGNLRAIRCYRAAGFEPVGEVDTPDGRALLMRCHRSTGKATMDQAESENIIQVREYLRALQAGVTGDALATFFTTDAQQVELPNRLNPDGGSSDLPTLLRRAEQGQHLLREQRYDVRSEVAQANRVAVEATWTGVLAVPLGSLPAGSTMKAHFAMFFELCDGRIRVQRNYDCFEPW